MAVTDLTLADVSLGEFLTSKYSLWFDLRTSNDDKLHGSGRHIANTSEGVTFLLSKRRQR